MTNPPRLFTEAEAAEALRLCERTLRKARQDGRLSYILVGRAVRYTSDDLEAFIARSRQDNECRERQPVHRSNVGRTGTARIVPFSMRRRNERL